MEQARKKKLIQWMDKVIDLKRKANALNGTKGCPELFSLVFKKEIHVGGNDYCNLGYATIFDLARALDKEPTITSRDDDRYYDLQASIKYRGYEFFALLDNKDLEREGIKFEK